MRKQSLIFLLLSVAFFYYTSAQVFVMDLPPGNIKVVSSEKEKGLDGTPWLTDSWIPGTVVLASGKKVEGLKYRYNVYRNLLYFQYENAEYVISSHDSIDHLIMGDELYRYGNSDPAKKDNVRLLLIAEEGKADLYINYYPVIIPANYNIALGSGNPNETVAVKESYLIKVGNELTLIDKKGKLIPVALADKKTEISEFIKKEKISAKNRADLIKVVRYYNSLKD